MRTERASLDAIAEHFVGTIDTGATVTVDNSTRVIAPNTLTMLNEINTNRGAGLYEVSFAGTYSYPTTRHAYHIGLQSTTHTVKIADLVHEPKDSGEINPEYDRFIFNHAGGDINFSVWVEHDHSEDLTVYYSDIKLVKIG